MAKDNIEKRREDYRRLSQKIEQEKTKKGYRLTRVEKANPINNDQTPSRRAKVKGIL
ncbi:MAG: hypothetical protein JXB14_08240 [Candidatus Altiarchaeota archaeon]|nr:hypothetical protein [Candidatus Altiarchaeota archaeon]